MEFWEPSLLLCQIWNFESSLKLPMGVRILTSFSMEEEGPDQQSYPTLTRQRRLMSGKSWHSGQPFWKNRLLTWSRGIQHRSLSKRGKIFAFRNRRDPSHGLGKVRSYPWETMANLTTSSPMMVPATSYELANPLGLSEIRKKLINARSKSMEELSHNVKEFRSIEAPWSQSPAMNTRSKSEKWEEIVVKSCKKYVHWLKIDWKSWCIVNENWNLLDLNVLWNNL